MDHFLTELHRHYTKLDKPLQAMADALLVLCKEADDIKGRIKPDHSADTSPNAQLESVIIKAEQTLPQKVLTLRQAEQSERAFCTTHKLIDKSVQPNAVISMLWISVCVFIDAAVNSSFLYNAHMVSGPFAALLVSFLISLTNVALSVSAGYFIGRFLSYGSNSADPEATEFKTIRNRARWQFRVFIGVMAFFILTVGLVRSMGSLDRVAHSLAHYHELLVTPEAVFLVLLNVCITIFSYNKGRTGFSHLYGDYSTYQQSVVAARDDLYRFYDDLVEEIEMICDDSEDNAKVQVTAQSKSAKQYHKKVTECHQAYRELQEAIRGAENEFSASVARLINSQSVLEGKNLTIPHDLLVPFAFTNIAAIKLPDAYRPSHPSVSSSVLAKEKAAALKRLSDVFKRALQS
ncbi:hypothetical protein SAMN05216420_10143 [Nitrosospira sp. Nl5]|uniref:hypothetical protein n=1 Tax=Nitrosospira sp. Nl5 TaxID=200120 RepID=UPI00088DC527|nr:hypothetical protein [Nitrosospira sp. Nl5]SCX83378.1 hypothetical protein SAMN05216420_10143 [Nitrosospira sp. Nl5]